MNLSFRKIIMIILFAAVVCSCFQGADVNAAAWADVDFSPYIVQSHPRLYVTSFDGLKEKYLSDPLTAKWYNDLLNEAAVISDGDVMCDVNGTKLYDIDKLNEQMSSRKYRRIISSQDVLSRFYVLAFAAACEDSKALADRLWLEVEDAINLPYWNTRHWLEPAEMMHSISIAYDWCYKFWSDEQKELMETKVYELGIGEAVREYNGYPRWYRWHYGFSGTEVGSNWTIVCNTGVLLTSLAFYDTNPTFYNTKINNAVRSMKAGLNAYSANGAFRENVMYWNYATNNLIMATDGFESAIGGNFNSLPEIPEPFHYDFSKAPGISHTPDFPIYANGPAGVFNYGDASGGSFTSSPAIMWIGNRFDKEHYIDYHLNVLEKNGTSGGVHGLLWYEGGNGNKESAKDKLFEENFVSMRSSWDDNSSLFVAMKGGINGKGHNHYDLGTFVLDYGGVRFARQLGAIGYDWSGGRPDFYKGRTEGQNAVVVNPDETAGQHTSGTSEFTDYYSGIESSYAILDTTDVYSRAVKGETEVDTAVTSSRRGVKMHDSRKRITIQDEFKMSEPSELYWFMHTGASVKLYNNNKSAILTSGGKHVYVNLLSNEDASFELVTAQPLPTSPTPEDQPDTYGQKLSIHFENVTDVTVCVEFVPSFGSEPRFTSHMTPLDEWHPESDVVISGRDVTIYGTDKPGRSETMLLKSPLGNVYGIGQEKVDAKGEYKFYATLPENYENGIYSVYINGSIYKTFEMTDGIDAGVSPATYTLKYDLPRGVTSSLVVAAEYSEGKLVQIATAPYDVNTSSATVVLEKNPAKGNTLKFFYFENMNNLKALYEPKEIRVT